MTQERRDAAWSDHPPRTADAPPSAQAAREEAANVAGTALDAGHHVARTTADHAREVAAEGTRQAHDVLREGREQLVEQARAGQRQAAQKINAFGDELVEMAGKTKGSGPGSELARRGAEHAHSVGAWLEGREPPDLLEEVRDFARRRPGTFLLGAAVAGAVVGRLTRGVVGRGRRDGDQPTPQRRPAEATPARPPIDEAPPSAPAARPVGPEPGAPPPPVSLAPASAVDAAPPTAELADVAPVEPSPPVDVPRGTPYGGWGPPPPGGFEPYPDEAPDGEPVRGEEWAASRASYERHGSVER